jgi:hypothetical protein
MVVHLQLIHLVALAAAVLVQWAQALAQVQVPTVVLV